MNVRSPKNSDSNLAVISPIGREGQTLREFLEIVQNNIVSGEIHILVTDKMTDLASLRIIEIMRIKYPETLVTVHVEKPAGIASLYLLGYQYALSKGYNYVLEIDAGLSHDPNQIGSFREKMEFCGAVFGSRFITESVYSGNLYRRIISQGGTFLTRAVTGIPMTDLTSGYQLFSRPVLEKILEVGVKSLGPFFQTEMKLITSRLGFTYCEVPITYSSPSHRIRTSILVESVRRLWELRD